MERKRFTSGTGRLDAQTLNLMAQAGYAYADQISSVPIPALDGPYLAIINPPSGTPKQELAFLADGVTPIKWAYDYVVVSPEWSERNGEYLWEANSDSWKTQGTGAGSVPSALNLCEINNTTTSLMGVDVSNIPDGYQLQPVPGTTHVMLWIASTPRKTGDVSAIGGEGSVAFFTYPNQFDGSC